MFFIYYSKFEKNEWLESNEQMRKELFQKYFRNHCSREEIDKLRRWSLEKDFEIETKIPGLEEWQSQSQQEQDNQISDENLSRLLDRIYHRINIITNKASGRKNNLKLFSLVMMRVAAILYIPVLQLLFYTVHANNLENAKYANLEVESLEVIALNGSRTVVKLADGSEVFLNFILRLFMINKGSIIDRRSLF